MTISKDGVFYAGETWVVSGQVRDAANKPMNLTGGKIRLRLGRNNALVKEYETPTNGSIVSPATNGNYRIVIPPSTQTADGLTEEAYEYSIWADLSDGTISLQNHGIINVKTIY